MPGTCQWEVCAGRNTPVEIDVDESGGEMTICTASDRKVRC